jgi:hypothetical protein
MTPLNLLTDGYERKARLYPALLLIAPIVITIVGVASTKLSTLESFATVLAGCGGAFLLTQLTRDAGKKREKHFFEAWGGLPSVAIFRHRDTRIDAITKARYHKQLSTLVKGTKAPSPEEETADAAMADQMYNAWSSYLRVHTRDTKKYSLLFQENISYGYRRNVCGLRPLGIIMSSLSLAVGAVWLYHLRSTMATITTESAGALICVFVILLLWAFRFTPEWVRIPADAYAERLAETVDSINGDSPSSKGRTKKGTA